MVQVETLDELAVVKLNHGKVNVLDFELLTELGRTLEQVENSAAQAVVLTGAGSCFSAGVDLFRIANEGRGYIQQFLPKLTGVLQQVFTFSKPMVAAINGHAIAGGCILAWACDYKIMAADSGKIGVSELAIGVPFPALPLEIVRFTVPTHYFQEVVYGADAYPTSAALAMGLLDAIAPGDKLLERAVARAKKYAAIPGRAFQLTKAMMRQPVIERSGHLQNKLDQAVEKYWQKPEAIKAVKQFIDKTISK